MAISSSHHQQDSNDPRMISGKSRGTDSEVFENSLRPKTLEEYIGQTQLKENLKIFLQAAKKREECLEHTLLYGPPGLGKTTMAAVIAHEMGGNFKITSAPAIEKQGDLAAILTNLKKGDVLFIDEIHRLRPNIEEILYSAMEDYALDIMIGKGPSARTMRINLPDFTLIGATTKFSHLSSPLRDRFGHILRLDFYSDEEIEHIIRRSANILQYQIDPKAAQKISSCARRTPRIANRLLKRIRDFAEMEQTPEKMITYEITAKALLALGIDHIGLDRTDITLIRTIIEKFQGGPVGLNTLSAAIGEDAGTIEDVYEPFLIQLGMLDRKARGRVATEHAYVHLGLDPSQKTMHKQSNLFEKTP
ncbi:MAG: Holliday junction branch migration DNA helicase RuvB [Candidatus Altimarinota bacterium]